MQTVFKTVERVLSPLAGSIPVRLRFLPISGSNAEIRHIRFGPASVLLAA